MPLAPGTRLGPYEITAALGAGGMGEVYRARDTRLGRDVAIKVLPHGWVADPERKRRLLQEARAVSALNHPNIVTLHDIACDDGVDYLVMEYVPGKNLHRLIPPDGLPLAESIDYGVQIASALAVAHAAGIVHRDIKPANAIVTPGAQIKVLDFGLAKLIEPSSPQLDGETRTLEPLTGTGVLMGTLGYMSPEQVRGDAVDRRSDIFSLGCVLYQMVTGKPPFARRTNSEGVAAILRDDPPPLTASGKPVPPELERLILHCLAKDPDQRFPSAGDLVPALKALVTAPLTIPPAATRHFSRRTVMAGGAAAFSAAAVGAYLRFGGSRPFESLAVLPLSNGTGDPANDYLSEGISASIINRLSQTSLRVTAFSTAARIKEKSSDPIAAARQLGVASVMTGRFTRQGNNLVIQVELVNPADGSQIWGNRFVHPLSEVQVFEEQIARNIAEALRLRLAQTANAHMSKQGTANPDAYKLYLQGQFYWNKKTEEGFRKSIEYFNQAIAVDPNYALPFAGLAHAYANLAADAYVLPGDVMPAAEAAAKKAISLDEALADGHSALGMYHIFYTWDWPAANAELQRAMALDQNSSDPLHFYGHYLEMIGRTDEAVSVFRKALDLDPLSLVINAEYGFAMHLARRFEEAVRISRKTLEMDRDFIVAVWVLAQALDRLGRSDEAIAELEKVRESGGPLILMELACAHAAGGRSQEARRILAEQFAKKTFVDAGLVAFVYAELHDTTEAFRWLEKAYDQRSPEVAFLKVDPRFDALRSDPRFQDLMRRLKLA